MNVRRSYFLDIPLDLVSMSDILELVRSSMANKRRLYQVTLNAYSSVTMQRDKEFAHCVIDADLMTADGMSLVWGARLLGVPVPERVSGIDIMYEVLDLCAKEGYRPYFLGARPLVLEDAVTAAKNRWAGLEFAGSHHGYFDLDEASDIVQAINDSHADCVFIGMTSPKKEEFCHQWNNVLNTPYIMGVGGSFDVLAGLVQRAPLSWQKYGLEWAYRLLQEPQRLWLRYLNTNTLFALATLRSLLFSKKAEIETRVFPTVSPKKKSH